MTLSRSLSSVITVSICLAMNFLAWGDGTTHQNAPQESCIDCAPEGSDQHFEIATIDWCPYICLGNDQKPGVLTEYVQKIFKDTGYSLSFTHMPWARAIHETHAGNFLALLAPAKEEAPGLMFPDQSLGYQTMCMYTRADDLWYYDGIRSLEGRRIVYAIGAYPASLEGAQDSAAFYPTSYNETFVERGLKMVLNKRTDTLLFTFYTTQDYINREGLKDEVKLAGCVQQQALYLAFTPLQEEKEKVQRLIEFFNQKVKELEKKNTFETLLKRYGLTPLADTSPSIQPAS